MVSHGEIFFGVTEELIKERRTRLERRVHESVLEVLRGASLTEILHSDELGEAAKRSPLLARNLEAYQELVTVLQKAQHAIQDATYGIGFGVGKAGCVHLKTDHGGQLLSWCEKNAADMPPALQADLELLLYSAQELSIKEQQRIISVLAAFHISHSTINLQVALAPLQQDLAALKALPDSSPHKVPELYEKAMQAIASATKAVSIDTKDEIRLDRLSDLLYTPLHEFRRAVNADLLAVYGDEFFEAVNSFKPFFCEGDNLKPDFRGEGIALESLKQTIYGAELGIRSFEKNIEPSKRFSALSRDDFFNVREAIYYLSISSRDESVSESLCGHLSIPNFKAVVTGVITAHRKATSIDTQYKNWHFDNGHAGLPEPVTSGNHLTAPVSAQLLGTFSPIVVKGRNILPKEEFAEEFGISLNHCVQVRDFLKFGKAHADSSKTIFDQWSFLADAGLYNAGVKDAEQDYLVRNGLRYLPRTVCQDIADRLAPLYRNPFIRIKEERFSSYPFDNRQKLEALFLEKQIVNSAKMFEAVLAEEDIIDAIIFPLSEQDRVNYIDASASRFLLRNHAPVAEGANSFTLVFGLGSTFIGEWKERKVAYTTIDGVQSSFKIQWLDAEGAVSRSRELLASTVPSDQLSTVQSLVSVLSAPSQTRPDTMLGGSMSRASEGERLYENFARRLRVVTLQRALGGSTQGSNPASKRIADELPHWIIAKNNPFRIERALIEDVYQATKIDPEVVTLHSDGWLRLHESSIEVVKGKKHKGVDLYDVLFRDPTYVTKYFAEIFQHKDSSRLIGAVLGAFQRARLAMGGDTGRRRVFIEEFTRSYFGV
jgi:hypothetical protein